jgi:hypothetical protein
MNAMYKRALLPLVLLAPALATQLHAAELEQLTAVELHALCQAYVHSPESADGRACVAYVRGFIEGSDEVIVRREDVQRLPRESFSERAWRTRLGISKPAPRYCLSADVSLQELVAQLLAQAERTPPAGDVSARALLYATLSRFHRCP